MSTGENSLVDKTSVVVKTSCQAQIKRELRCNAEGISVVEKKLHLLQGLESHLVVGEFLDLHQLCKSGFWLSFYLNILTDLVGNFLIKALFVHHLGLDRLPRLLVKLVNSRADRPEFISRNAGNIEHSIEKTPVIDLHLVRADGHTLENLAHHREHLRIGNHHTIVSSNIQIALIKLSEPSSAHRRVVTAVHASDVVAFDGGDAIHRDKTSERHGQVIAKREELSALVGKVINELGIFTVLAGQCFFSLKNRGVDGHRTVLFEDIRDYFEHLFAHSHLLGVEITRTLGDLRLSPQISRGHSL
mmetsp:Transcript_43604/g.113582  ORF Transcript_43604/g.113582 Transcript_43604/m.113582 type:complete len:302 (+) Transcript_43604:1330-2235(+)